METSPSPALSPSTAAEPVGRNVLASSLKRMVDEAEQLLKSLQNAGGEQFAVARERFEQQLRFAKIELDELETRALASAKAAARATDEAVHEHPYAAMAIAAGVGALIGMLIARR